MIFKNWDELIPKLKTLFVTSQIRQGKTSFSYYLLEKIKKYKKVYVFKHPNPDLVTELGFNNMYSIDEVEDLNDACIYIDEPQIVFPKYDKRGSVILNKLLSLVGQKDITLILSTSDTRYITASEEFYVNMFVIKKLDIDLVKRGSKVKSILNEMATITPRGYAKNIKINEYVLYFCEDEQYNRKYTFKMPDYFDDRLSKPFRKIFIKLPDKDVRRKV